MAIYILRQDAFLGGALRSKGERVVYDGPPAPYMSPIEDDDDGPALETGTDGPAPPAGLATLSSPRLKAAPLKSSRIPKGD